MSEEAVVGHEPGFELRLEQLQSLGRLARRAARLHRELAALEKSLAGLAEPNDSADRAKVCGSETILVIDDRPHVRAVTVTLLEHLGYRAIVAEAGSASPRPCPAGCAELASARRRPLAAAPFPAGPDHHLHAAPRGPSTAAAAAGRHRRLPLQAASPHRLGPLHSPDPRPLTSERRRKPRCASDTVRATNTAMSDLQNLTARQPARIWCAAANSTASPAARRSALCKRISSSCRGAGVRFLAVLPAQSEAVPASRRDRSRRSGAETVRAGRRSAHRSAELSRLSARRTGGGADRHRQTLAEGLGRRS